MLTIRQNLLETMKGGHPYRFVKQYEFLEIIMVSKLPNLPYTDSTKGHDYEIATSTGFY